MPNQLERPLPSHRRDSTTRSCQPFRDGPGVCSAPGAPKSAEPVLGTSRANDVPIQLTLANRIHHWLREPLALAMSRSTLPWEKVTQGAPDHTPNIAELVLFGGRLGTNAPNNLLALQFTKQLVCGRPRCKLPPELSCDQLHPSIVGDNFRPLVPSQVDLRHRRFRLFVGSIIPKRDVPFLALQALDTFVRLALLDLRRSSARMD